MRVIVVPVSRSKGAPVSVLPAVIPSNPALAINAALIVGPPPIGSDIKHPTWTFVRELGDGTWEIEVPEK